MDYYKASPEIVALVEEIVNEHHERLDGAKIAVICKDKASKSKGKITMASMGLPTPRLKPLFDQPYHFVLVIALDVWETIDQAQKRALIDHELCHAAWGNDGYPVILGHDLEEFAAVLARHGLWRGDCGEREVQAALLKQGITVATIG